MALAAAADAKELLGHGIPPASALMPLFLGWWSRAWWATW